MRGKIIHARLNVGGENGTVRMPIRKASWPPLLVCWSIDTAYRGWLAVSKHGSET